MPTLDPVHLSLDEQVTSLREDAGALMLDDRVLRVGGIDRASWLSGMVTADTKDLRPGQCRYAAFVQVKGKIITDAWIYVRTDDVLVAVHPRSLDVLVPHLEHHIIMEDVEVALLPEARVVSVQGPRAFQRIGTNEESRFPADRLGRGGVDWVVMDENAAREALTSAGVPTVSESAWEIARLEAAVPRFGVDFGEDNYVQEANITSRAVSFSKGCYVGQEVVCRLEMRGHVRRQLVALVIECDEPPPAGTPVVREGTEVGSLTSSARSPAMGRVVALAMLKWDLARAGGFVEVAGRTARIVSRPLP